MEQVELEILKVIYSEILRSVSFDDYSSIYRDFTCIYVKSNTVINNYVKQWHDAHITILDDIIKITIIKKFMGLRGTILELTENTPQYKYSINLANPQSVNNVIEILKLIPTLFINS